MLAFYIVAGLAGGVLLLLSLLGGHHETEIGGDHDVDHDLSHDVGHGDHDGHFADWLPFFSLRFWTYMLAAFGATGWLLTVLSNLSPIAALPFALVTGFIAGLVPTLALRLLRRQEKDSSIKTQDMVGQMAEVLVAVRPGQVGRVRAEVHDEIIDLLAVPDGTENLEPGTRVVIVGAEFEKVRVVSAEAIFGDTQLAQNGNGNLR